MKKIDIYLWEVVLFLVAALDISTMLYIALFEYYENILSMIVILANLCFLAWVYSINVKYKIESMYGN